MKQAGHIALWTTIVVKELCAKKGRKSIGTWDIRKVRTRYAKHWSRTPFVTALWIGEVELLRAATVLQSHTRGYSEGAMKLHNKLIGKAALPFTRNTQVQFLVEELNGGARSFL